MTPQAPEPRGGIVDELRALRKIELDRRDALAPHLARRRVTPPDWRLDRSAAKAKPADTKKTKRRQAQKSRRTNR